MGWGRTVGLGLLGVGAGLELQALRLAEVEEGLAYLPISPHISPISPHILRLAEVEEGLARVDHIVRDRGLGGAACLRDIREIWGDMGRYREA